MHEKELDGHENSTAIICYYFIKNFTDKCSGKFIKKIYCPSNT